MIDERWKPLLPLLQEREPIAQGEMCSSYYDYVFGTLLKWARWANSEAGAPVPDPELRDLVNELTGEAFARAFAQIDKYDPTKVALPTWIIWIGRARMKGIVGSAIDHGVRGKGHIHLDDEVERASHADQLEASRGWVAPSPEDEIIQRESAARITAILRAMPADQARALVEVYVRSPPGRGRIGMVAHDMGRSSSAMDSLLRRAVKEFARRLEGDGADSDEAGIA
jgi:DNA-directed RNA polymerase specialized sigma24 family protein